VTDTRHRVEIFLGPLACSCAGMPSPAKLEKIDRSLRLISGLEENCGDVFSVKTWDLGTDEDYEEGIQVLGRYLREAENEELADHLAFAVKDATPSVAVDEKLVWIRDCPSVVEILERFGTGAISKPS